ncbi:nitrilase-related carbon-nitrogen hydrolase [Brucella pituitosa]|uniref:nitrilase-related carbon-nitrogen hydrolase n=1 Tax=Brucella pituitosa TaxID=571256 RepID=UPI003F4A8E16
MIKVYTAVLASHDTKCIANHADLMENVQKACDFILNSGIASVSMQLDGASDYEPYAPVKLIAFPESHLHGWPFIANRDLTVEEMDQRNLIINIPGPETDMIGKACSAVGIYAQCVALERNPHFPGRIFNTAFIIDPKGEVIHVYRKVMPAMHIELTTSPCDILDEYMAVFGKGKTILETLYPVTDTEIGKLGVMICNDGHYPESYRALAMNGAEVIIHSDWFSFLGVEPNDMFLATNRAAAWSNLVYMICPTSADITNWAGPKGYASSSAAIIDYSGHVVAQIPFAHGEQLVGGTIFLEQLRRRRMDPGRNLLSHTKSSVWREIYNDEIHPNNLLADKRIHSVRDAHLRNSYRVGAIQRLIAKGTYTPPE